MFRLAAVLFLSCFSLVPSAMAEGDTIELRIKDHMFLPDTITIEAEKRVKLIVINQDATPEEFESYELNREKIIPGKSKAIIYIGPLEKGEYPFFGEFHMQTAKGRVIVK